MMSFFDKLLDQPKSQPCLAFVPAIRIQPNSTLHLEVQPNDPHTASNIVITAFASKKNRIILPIRVQWSRYKFKSQSQYIIQKMQPRGGNTYMCQPSDLGSIINAKVKSLDPNFMLQGEVSIGPIRIDVMLKRLIDGALYNGSLLSQVIVVDQKQTANINMRLNQNKIQFVDQNTSEVLIMDYTPSQPKLQLSQADPTKVFLRFQQDQTNKTRNWLNKLFKLDKQSKLMNQSSASIHIPHSNISSVSSNKLKLFPKYHTPCINKLQIKFLSRNSRDLFVFSLRAFLAKEDMKNSVIMTKIQTLQTIKTQEDYHKFLQYISLKAQIIRLSEAAKEFQQDRDSKVRDISQLEDSISEMTKTYLKIIQEKSQNQAIDLEQSYSMISLKREQILGRRNFRQLKSQNEQLKIRVRDLNEQLQLQAFFRRQDNQSMMLNQTSNPFAKKNQNSATYANMNMLNVQRQNFNLYNNNQPNHKNMLDLSKSYLKVLQENKKLKSRQKQNTNPNIDIDKSQDIEQLLDSLHQNDEQEKHLIQAKQNMDRLKIENQRLFKRIQELQRQKNIPRPINSSKISRSIANQQLLGTSYRSNVSLDTSMSQSMSINQSMTSQSELNLLQKKLIDLALINTKYQSQNARLRRQRDHYRSLYESKQRQITTLGMPTQQYNYNNNNKYNNNNNKDQSNLLDNSYIFKVRQQNETLQNQKNSLLKKIDSLVRESNSMKNDSVYEKKCIQLTRQNDKLVDQNQRLQKTIQNMKNYHDLEKNHNHKQALSSDHSHYSNSNSKSGVNKNSNDYLEQITKLKKTNAILLQEVKQLRMELERKNDSRLYNSRVIELENQLNFVKGQGQSTGYNNNNNNSSSNSNNHNHEQREMSAATQQLLDQIIKQKKENEKLKEQRANLQAKIRTQTQLIEKLMSQNQAFHQSNINHNHISNPDHSIEQSIKLRSYSKLQTPQTTSSKQKSYSQKCTNNTLEQVQKYKKKIKQLQQQIILMRRNSDALNRSRDLSMDMQGYYQQKMQVLKRQNQNLILQNQNLSKMCSKYSKDAREAHVQLNKLKQKFMSQMKSKLLLSKNNNDQSSLLSN